MGIHEGMISAAEKHDRRSAFGTRRSRPAFEMRMASGPRALALTMRAEASCRATAITGETRQRLKSRAL
jgi:hypothetical protein